MLPDAGFFFKVYNKKVAFAILLKPKSGYTYNYPVTVQTSPDCYNIRTAGIIKMISVCAA